MNLMDVMQRFPTEDECIAFLEQRRWPKYVMCLKCQSAKVKKYDSTGKSGKLRKIFQCLHCQYQFTVTTGTIFHDSHLDLRKWFVAIAMIVDAKKGVSANQMKRHLKVSYKTAWHLCHRIRQAMEEGDLGKLTGTIEVDEVYLGGKVRGYGSFRNDNKTPVVAAVQRGGGIRFKKMPFAGGVGSPAVKQFLKEVVSEKAQMICTDNSNIYPGAMAAHDWTKKHQSVNHSAMEYVRGIVHTNTVESAFSLLQRGLIGTFHQLSHKHLDRYLTEFGYRHNNRKTVDLFGKLTGKAVESEPLPYKKLIGKVS